MSGKDDVRSFILEKVGEHPTDISAVVQDHFGISRQAASKHLKKLVAEGKLVAQGETRARRWRLASVQQVNLQFEVNERLDESSVWRTRIAPLLEGLSANTLDIWHYACTEMINNVRDHSDAKVLFVDVDRTALETVISVSDDGIGIFRKIKEAFGLEDLRHAVLELSKGKLTTDPANHSGEGIFFTSRSVDEFAIYANGLFADHKASAPRDWVVDTEHNDGNGTVIEMRLANNAGRSLEAVFDEWTVDKNEPVFSRTAIPVHLLRYGTERLVSRSQAKRLLARVDRFSQVIFDFTGVEAVGQAFADEIFRVFARNHPDIELETRNASESVKKMIRRAELERAAEEGR